jgi:hypothetical protein
MRSPELWDADHWELDAGVKQLVATMAGFMVGNPGFNPAQALQMPNDSGLKLAVATAWHH